MSDRLGRRDVLRGLGLGSAAGLSALAGCSSVPFVGDDDPELGFDPSELSASLVAEIPEQPSPYPGPVPDDLAATHRERARELVDGVPAEPEFPNGAIAERLARERSSVVESLDGNPEETHPLERLGHWRYRRSNAAEVRGAYEAATGDVDAETLARRREAVRDDLTAFENAWEYPGTDVVSAVAVAQQVEGLRNSCLRSLSPSRPFPESPESDVFAVGRLVGGVEHARAKVTDLNSLDAAYREASSELGRYREALSILSWRLEEVVDVSRHQVQPFVRERARPADFERDVEGLPAEELFLHAKVGATGRIEASRSARERRDFGRSVVLSGQALVSVVALSTVVDAIREGKYGMPESADAVRRARDDALAALREARSLEPRTLAATLSLPAWSALDDQAYMFERRGRDIGTREVVRLTASFVLARHLAAAVPEVHSRVREELSDLGPSPL